MGLIHRWSRAAGAAPALANFVTQTPGLSALAKAAAGIAPERRIPRYSHRSFTQWFRRRRNPRGNGGKRVLLWPDTFNNYFRAPTAIAAVQALEQLGYQVVLPRAPVCCGRPLYDWGRLAAAKQLWRHNIETLADELMLGTPIVGLEPACVSAFRDELPGLFPGDERAQMLSRRTRFLTEFLNDEEFSRGSLLRGTPALVQLHCHHHAVLDERAERHVLDALGLDYEVMASGCCGMAGSFGLEKSKYAVSMGAAERVLLPRLRAAEPGTLVVANGFSCREQIEQAGDWKTMHIAELLNAGLQPAPLE